MIFWLYKGSVKFIKNSFLCTRIHHIPIATMSKTSSKDNQAFQPNEMFLKFYGTTNDYTLTNIVSVLDDACSWYGRLHFCYNDHLMDVATSSKMRQDPDLGLQLASTLGEMVLEKHTCLHRKIIDDIQKHIQELQDLLDLRLHFENGLWGFRNPQGQCSLPACWTDAFPFSEGLAAVADKKGHFGYINLSGEVVIPCRFAFAWPFQDGLAIVENRNGHQGFINHFGKWEIPPLWDRVEPFSGPLAAVMDANCEWGYIHRTGHIVVPCEWAEAEPFNRGLARVWDTEGNPYLINLVGDIIRILKREEQTYLSHED